MKKGLVMPVVLFLASVLAAGCIEDETGSSDPQPTLIWHHQGTGPVLMEGAVYHVLSGPSSDSITIEMREGSTVTRFDVSDVGEDYWVIELVGRDGVLFVSIGPGLLIAIAPGDGAELWRTNVSGLGPPIATDGLVLVAHRSGPEAVSAFDARTGDLRWTREFPAGLVIHEHVTAHGDAIYVPTEDDTTVQPRERGFVFALDASSGEDRWTTETIGISFDPLTVADGIVYSIEHVTDADPRVSGLRARDAVTGNELWTVEHLVAAPVVVDGVGYVSYNRWLSPDGHDRELALVAIDARTGTELWRSHDGNIFTRHKAVADGVVYSYNHDGHIYAHEAENGTMLWRFMRQLHPTRADAYPALIVDQGILYMGGGAIELEGDGNHQFPAADIPAVGVVAAALALMGVVIAATAGRWNQRGETEGQPRRGDDWGRSR